MFPPVFGGMKYLAVKGYAMGSARTAAEAAWSSTSEPNAVETRVPLEGDMVGTVLPASVPESPELSPEEDFALRPCVWGGGPLMPSLK